MRNVLLGFAASLAALASAPAAAQFGGGPAPSFGSSGSSHWPGHGGWDRGRHRGGAVVVGGWGYDREWQGDSAWRSQSFNDWWHERPARSYPRWMSNNSNCDRLWWGGGVWRCGW